MSDPITRWIPELGNSAGRSARDELDVIHWEDITVGDAAAHLSGLGGDMTTELSALDVDWESPGLPQAPAAHKVPSYPGHAGTPVCTREEFLNIFHNYRPPVYQPSQSPVHSNAGIRLVGLVVEAASNRTFEVAINDLILKPLALQHTSTGIIPGNAKNMFIPAGSADWDVGAGGMGSSTADLLSFMANILKNKIL
ncbi:uncharacterized protein FTOL_07116 [Fusarium torulosum]|uniref:Beta-lactamase-related domain-containing protein n=1 Tax=Fusarium torulosum TaxID=33205 RepID=A0AAE8MBD1_9HYPO|nr:uncharacterized protein FTOL_07116 [Fusarium torulosum]